MQFVEVEVAMSERTSVRCDAAACATIRAPVAHGVPSPQASRAAMAKSESRGASALSTQNLAALTQNDYLRRERIESLAKFARGDGLFPPSPNKIRSITPRARSARFKVGV